MDLEKIVTTSAVAAVLAFGAAPVDAQGHDRHARDRNESGARQERRAPRGDRSLDRAVPRENVRPQQQGRLGREPGWRQEFQAPQHDGRRLFGFREPGHNGRRGFEFRDPRHDHRGSFDARRFRGPTIRVVPRFRRVVPYRFYTPRPYRPGLHLGFGIFFGQPYSHRFWYPASPYDYPIAAPVVAYGGVGFEIWPPDADIYVDGNYVGAAEQFGPGTQPLTLVAGRHRMELQAPGHVPMVFDVDVLPGRVIPCHIVMQPGY